MISVDFSAFEDAARKFCDLRGWDPEQLVERKEAYNPVYSNNFDSYITCPLWRNVAAEMEEDCLRRACISGAIADAEATCPVQGCGGTMEYGGMALLTDPPKYPHVCKECGYAEDRS